MTTDVTDLIRTNTTTIKHGTSISLPNGLNMTVQLGGENAYTSFGPSLSYNNTPLMDAKLYDYFGIYLSMPRTSEPWKPEAVEILFYWCVNTYQPTIQDNVLDMKHVLSHTEIHHGDAVAKSWWNSTLTNVSYLTSPADEGATYVVDGRGPDEIRNLFNESLSGFSVNLGYNQLGSGSDRLMHAHAVAKNDTKEAWLEVINGMARNIANGISNS